MSDLQVNLHSHSQHSFLDGFSKVEQIARRASELGQSYAAITDHGEVSGHLAFSGACEKHGVGPILGIEAYWTTDLGGCLSKKYSRLNEAPISHICLLAASNTGLSNLWALSSVAYDRDHHWYKPLADVDLLRTYSKDVFASDGCLLTVFADLVDKGDEDGARQVYGTLLDIYGDRFYVELHTWQFVDDSVPERMALNARMRGLNHAKVRLAAELGIPLVVVNDSHHAYPEHWVNKELVWAFNTSADNDKLEAKLGEMAQKADHHMGEDELYLWMGKHGISADVVAEAVKNSYAIAESCKVQLTPTLGVPRIGATDRDDLQALITVCEAGFQEKVIAAGLDEDCYHQRLESELRLIAEKNFAGYFLMVRDYTIAFRSGTWAQYIEPGSAKKPMVVGPGRGSVGGSLVAYLCGIDIIDPLHYGTLFSRFISPGRKDLPDIDLDVPQSQRPHGMAYLSKRFGSEKVCAIGTVNRNGAKATIRDLGRAMKIDRNDINAIAEHIDQVERFKREALEINPDETDLTWEELIERKGGDLAPWMNRYPQLFKKTQEMMGLARHTSVHAAGILVSSEPLLGRIPLRTRKHNTKDEITTTQFDMNECIAGDALVNGVPVRDLVGVPPATLRSLDENTGTMVTNQVVRVVHKGVKELVRINLVDGKILRCTPDHLIYTRRGWVQAGDLTSEDEVMVDA